MRRNQVILIALSLAIQLHYAAGLIAAPPAMAEEANQQSRAIERAGISLSTAIENIESATGGRVVMAAVQPLLRPPSLLRGPLVYELMVLRDDKLKTYFVEIFTGQVLAKHGAWAGRISMTPPNKDEIFSRAPISLREAIDMGEKAENGKTVLARTIMYKGLPCYEITGLDGRRYRRVRIDAFNGNVKPVHMGPFDVLPFAPRQMFNNRNQ